MKKRFGVAIVGGSGYGAGELLRLLAGHPDIDVCSVVTRSHVGKSVDSIHSHLLGVTSLVFEDKPNIAALSRYERAAIVLAMPSGAAVKAIEELLASDIPSTLSLIDLSGDLRLVKEEQHNEFYPEAPFAKDVRSLFTYGLPEVAQPTRGSGIHITNPGCLATAAIMALAPLRTFTLEKHIVIDAKTGTSGAGREPQASMHHPSRCADFTAYKTLQHRHEPEILQALGEEFEKKYSVMFVPHLIPTSRGIFVSVYANLVSPSDGEKLTNSFASFYRDAPFVRLRASPPRLVDVVGTNFCDISVTARGSQVVVMSAIDNLGKGMAGQAIQNMNRVFGLPQETGLKSGAIGPV